MAQFRGLDAPPSLHVNSNLSNERVAANFLGQSPSSLSDPSIHTTPKRPWGEDSSSVSRGASVREHSSPAATSNHHEHRCWVCDNTNAITTCDAFKKHVRAHTARFHCMMCVGRSYPRRYILIKHLKIKHGVDDASVLANRSKYTVHKKYFACGFCVSCFLSLNEQINHIDAAHYRYSEHIPDWDSDKVIQGLLSQPGVNEHWRSALTANHHPQESWSRCNPTQVQKLQLRLELSQEPADVLCNAAIAGLTGLEMDTSQSMQTIRRQSAMSPLPSTSEQGFTTHAPWMTAPTLQSQDGDAIFEDSPLPQIASETNGSPAHAVYNHADHRSQPRSSLTNSENIMQQQYPAHMPSIASASGISRALGGQVGISHSSSLGGHSQGGSHNVASSPRSRQMAEAYNYPIEANMGWLPTMATQSPPSPSSHNLPISLSRPLSSTYSPTYHQNLDAQLSCQETTDYPGIDMDVDSDHIQRFMQDQDHTRGQRCSH